MFKCVKLTLTKCAGASRRHRLGAAAGLVSILRISSFLNSVNGGATKKINIERKMCSLRAVRRGGPMLLWPLF